MWDNQPYAMLCYAKLLQSCPTLCDPIDGSPPGSVVPGILQARILEWVAISFSNGWKWKVKVKLLSCVQLLGTPWTAAYQAPLSMGFSRREYWSGLPLPSLWISHKYTYIPSLLNLPPPFLPIPPLYVDKEPLFEFPEPYSKFLLAIYFTYGNISFHVTLSMHLTLSSPLPCS